MIEAERRFSEKSSLDGGYSCFCGQMDPEMILYCFFASSIPLA
jgi:hypothetical protein